MNLWLKISLGFNLSNNVVVNVSKIRLYHPFNRLNCEETSFVVD